MISDQMVTALHEIRNMQQDIGIGKAPEINTYQDEATLYRSLKRMEALGLIKEYKAPTKNKLSKTYKVTEFGNQLLQNAENLDKNFKPEQKNNGIR